MRKAGMVAAGHPVTAHAAQEILKAGGNAFDATIAAFFAATVAEPVLCTLAGGGFLLAKPAASNPVLYDFFTQTPINKLNNSESDFYPIVADFGTAQQEFHIGLGSVATPGAVSGLYAIHRELCTMSMHELVAPAIDAAKNSIPLNDFQSYIFEIIKPIYQQQATTIELFEVSETPPKYQQVMADFMEVLAYEGEALFYHGEIAQSIETLCRERGGHLQRSDFEQYQTIKRKPLRFNYREATLFTNPPPSSGGILIALALDLLNQQPMGSSPYQSLMQLITSMELTHEARLASNGNHDQLLNPDLLARYRREFINAVRCYRGTTQISIIDHKGNSASLTTSNGEGCGTLIPNSAIMLNNMLGEEDLHPLGFDTWATNQRMTSMMSPSIVIDKDGREIVLGSGGSNRIRSAITQVLVNLIDHHMPISEAITAPRIHLEKGDLNIEGGFEAPIIKQLLTHYPEATVWDDLNLFFGGVHAVMKIENQFSGFGDPRRGGYAK